MPRPVILILATMLLIGAAPLPYGYYSLLRIAATIVFAWGMVISLRREYEVLPWAFGVLAILFNPFVKVYLTKEIWSFIDIGCAIFLIAMSRRIERDTSPTRTRSDD